MRAPAFFVYDDYRVGVTTEDGVSYDVCSLHDEPCAGDPEHATSCLARSALNHGDVLHRILNGEPQPVRPGILRPPAPRPRNIFGAPVNYTDHRGELGLTRSVAPGTTRDLGLFVKTAGSVSGPSDPIELPNLPGREFHYEGEIAVVIGREAEDVPVDEALTYVAGLTGALDLTMRMETDFREERSMRKSYKTFTPVGPVVVPITDPEIARTMPLRLELNDEQRQSGDLSQLIVPVDELVALASSIVPLRPGDLILTGTPRGVGPIVAGDKVALFIGDLPPMSLVVEQKTGALSAAGWIKNVQ